MKGEARPKEKNRDKLTQSRAENNTAGSQHKQKKENPSTPTPHQGVKLQSVVTSLATHFIELGSHQIKAGISHALQTIGSHLHADAAYLFQVTPQTVLLATAWHAEALSPEAQEAQKSAVVDLANWTAVEAMPDRPHIQRAADIPSELKETLEAQNVSSFLTLPLAQGGGFLIFASARAGTAWEPKDSASLLLLGEILDRALARKTAAGRENQARQLGEHLADKETNTLLSYAVNWLQETFGYHHVQVYLYIKTSAARPGSATEERLILQASTGEAGLKMKNRGHTILLNTRRSLVAAAARTRQAAVANNVQQAPKHMPNPLLAQTRSEAALPLTSKERLLGVLDIQHNKTNQFTDEEVRILHIAAGQLAVALAATKRMAQNQRWQNELHVLHEFIRIAATADDEDELITQVTQIASETLYLETFGVRLLDPKSGHLRDHPSYRLANPDARSLRITSPGEGITGRVVATGQPWRIDDTTREPAYIGLNPQIRSELCVPLKINDQIMGVINAESTQVGAFGEEDERLLATMADHLATSIERIRFHRQTQHQNEEKAALLATARAISSLHLENVLHTIASEARQLLKANSSRIHLRDRGSDVLRCVIVLPDEPQAAPPFPNVKIGKGITGSVAMSGLPEVVKNTQKDRRHLRLWDTSKERQPESVALAPLKIRQQVIGVMVVSRRDTSNPFSATDLPLLTALADQAAVAIENVRLFEAERRRLEELTFLHAVAMAGAESSSEDELLERVTKLIGTAIASKSYGILLLNEAHGTLQTHTSYRGAEAIISARHGIVGRTATSGQPWRIDDMAREPRSFAIEKDTRSVLCVPLKIGKQVMGVVNLESPTPHAFSEAERRLLTTLAGQLGTALEKVRLFEAEHRRAMQQRRLARAAGNMLAVLNVSELWPTVTAATQETLDADRTAVFLYDPKYITCPYAHGLSGTYIEELKQNFDDAPDSRVLYHGQPIAVDDVASDPTTEKLRELMTQEGFRSYAVFPLSHTKGLMGGLAVYRDSSQSFTQDDLATGQTLAHIIAAALQNIQLFAEKTHALLREQRFNEITRALNRAPDLPTLLASFVRMATELIHADAGALGLVVNGHTMTFYPYNLPEQFTLQPLPKSKGLSWYIVETGDAYRLSDYKQHPKARQEWIEAGVHAFIGVPLVANEERLGALTLFNLDPDKLFSRRDLALAESVGRQAGVAIQNARFYSEIKQRAQTLSNTLARQEELDNLKDLFIQNMSHELRTPLGLIYGHAELLESGSMGLLEPEQLDSVRIIARRARMLSDLVEDLSALLAVETQEFKRELISPAELIHAILLDFQIMAEEMDITLQTEIEPELPWLKGDVTHLSRVFDNLLGNAFKFTPAGGTVTVHVWPEGKNVGIEVTDTGIGIPEDELDYIFERFYQVKPTSRPRQPGTGLGLALVKEIVEAHKGQVTVHSQEGKGTTFRITLPGYEVGEGV